MFLLHYYILFLVLWNPLLVLVSGQPRKYDQLKKGSQSRKTSAKTLTRPTKSTLQPPNETVEIQPASDTDRQSKDRVFSLDNYLYDVISTWHQNNVRRCRMRILSEFGAHAKSSYDPGKQIAKDWLAHYNDLAPEDVSTDSKKRILLQMLSKEAGNSVKDDGDFVEHWLRDLKSEIKAFDWNPANFSPDVETRTLLESLKPDDYKSVEEFLKSSLDGNLEAICETVMKRSSCRPMNFVAEKFTKPAEVAYSYNIGNSESTVQLHEIGRCVVRARGEGDCVEKDRKEKDYVEKDHVEKDHVEKDRVKKDHVEKDRKEKDNVEKDRKEKDNVEKEHMEKDHNMEKNRAKKDHVEKDRKQKDNVEKDHVEKDHMGKDRTEKDHVEKGRVEKELVERDQEVSAFRIAVAKSEKIEKNGSVKVHYVMAFDTPGLLNSIPTKILTSFSGYYKKEGDSFQFKAYISVLNRATNSRSVCVEASPYKNALKKK